MFLNPNRVTFSDAVVDNKNVPNHDELIFLLGCKIKRIIFTMKFFPLGDPHIDPKTHTVIDAAIPQILDVIRNEPDLDFMVCLGDILDKPGKVDEPSYRRAIAGLMKPIYNLMGTKPYLIIGNHDRTHKDYQNANEHFFNGYDEWLVVVDRVIIERNCVFVPWVKEGSFENKLVLAGVDMDRLDASHPNRYTCVFAHVEIHGCDMEGKKSENADHWPENRVPLISGHIHKYGRLRNNVIYPGTFYMKTFGEDEDKAVSIMEIDKDFAVSEKRIRLQLPKKLTLKIAPSEVKSFVPNNFDSYRLIVRGSTQEIDLLARYFDELRSKGIVVDSFKNDIITGQTRAIQNEFDLDFGQELRLLAETEEEKYWLDYLKI